VFDINHLHHAYFIFGDKENILSDINNFLEKSLNIKRQGNPDVLFYDYEVFGIDEGRELQSKQYLKPVISDKKIFVIYFDSITVEAQNALLKCFEEPALGTHFFIISNSDSFLLPTLRSRIVVIRHKETYKRLKDSEETNDSSLVKEFINSLPKKRLEIVSKMVEEKDKNLATSFINNLILELCNDDIKKISNKKAKAIKEIVNLSKYLKDRSSSLKLILERISLLEF